MNAPHVAPPPTATQTSLNPDAVADQWLGQWQAACSSGQHEELASCLTPDCHWRDLVAFHWSVQTWSGQNAVAQQLGARLPATTPTQWRRHATKALTRWVERDGHEWLEVSIEFDTQLARGEGLVRLKRGNALFQNGNSRV